MKSFFVCFSLLFSMSAAATSDSQTTLISVERPTEPYIRKAISTLYRSLKPTNSATQDRLVNEARKLLEPHKIRRTYPGAVYVASVKQFENGTDSVYDFAETCFKGKSEDVARLISLALEQNLWSGDEESVQSAKALAHSVVLTLHDGPNDTYFETEIYTCKK